MRNRVTEAVNAGRWRYLIGTSMRERALFILFPGPPPVIFQRNRLTRGTWWAIWWTILTVGCLLAMIAAGFVADWIRA